MIVLDSVVKQYGDHRALDDVSFSIEPGEFVFVLGPSGAGKTTIRKLLIKELEPTSGEIQVGEYSLTKMSRKEVPSLRRQIGIVFQDYKLLPDRTAAENIALALEIAGKTDIVIKKTVPKLLDLVGLPEKGNLFPNQLSGGEAQRVVIARALASDPAVLFADEPTGNLDKEHSMVIVDLLQKINHHGTAVVMATHDNEIVSHLKGTRIIRLDAGRVVEDTGAKTPKTSSKNTSDTDIES